LEEKKNEYPQNSKYSIVFGGKKKNILKNSKNSIVFEGKKNPI
jgi:hypothetical protein